tara:strand:- start:9443 stop:10771 length:1329 start_codon:yes stop_codon:yes gene_type:complete
LDKFDLIIIGDGILGKLTALRVLENTNCKIALIGNNLNNASKASGAMIAVYGELEDTKLYDEHDKLILNLSERSNSEWRKVINNLDKKIITAKKTIVYLKNNANSLEKKCFKTISNYGKSFDNKRNPKKGAKYLLLKDEFAISSKRLFDNIDSIIFNNKNFKYFDDQAVINESNDNRVQLKKNNKTLISDKILIAAGSNSSNITNKIKMVPIYSGVGTALEIESKELSDFLDKNTVYRTANRGGSYCGVHLVPRNNKDLFYLGAGNYLTKNQNSIGRMATVKYLIEALSKEISNDYIAHKTKMKMVYGNRPISFDNKPVLGVLHKNKRILIASGFNRVGLTLSPVITNEILNWLKNSKINSDFDKWSPNRKLVSFRDKDMAIKIYADFFLSNLIEHNLINKNMISITKDKLLKEAQIKHNLIQKKFNLKTNFGISPEILSIF